MQKSTDWVNGKKSNWCDRVIDQIVGSEGASAKLSCSAMSRGVSNGAMPR
jgi:hypothetical protein